MIIVAFPSTDSEHRVYVELSEIAAWRLGMEDYEVITDKSCTVIMLRSGKHIVVSLTPAEVLSAIEATIASAESARLEILRSAMGAASSQKES